MENGLCKESQTEIIETTFPFLVKKKEEKTKKCQNHVAKSEKSSKNEKRRESVEGGETQRKQQCTSGFKKRSKTVIFERKRGQK